MRDFILAAALLIVLWLFIGSQSTDRIPSLFDGGSGDSPFSLSQLKKLWIQYGGDPAQADMAAAVAMAESGGNPNAYNGDDPHGGSFGLFQINGVHGSDASFDVPTNVREAISLSNNGQNWNPWGAFTNGSFLQFWGSDVDAAGGIYG